VNAVELTSILPELILVLGGGLLVLADAFLPARRSGFAVLSGGLIAAAAVLRLTSALPGKVWSGALIVDATGRFADVYILGAALLVTIIAAPYLERTKASFGEFHGLLLWAACGAMVLAKAGHLVTAFVGLELLSVALYVLNAFHHDSGPSLEAGFKYLMMGGFASAVLLFGIALVYGASGTMALDAVALHEHTGAMAGSLLAYAGMGLIVAGLGFKLALFPFHAWAPDVYQGSPTPVTAFLSVVPKGAVLILLARVVASVAPASLTPHWTTLLAVIAVASQTLGNLVAISQRDIKRMLAYSGIAHMGYALLGIIAMSSEGFDGVLVYLAGYTLMNIAAFAVVSAFSEGEEEPHLIDDLAGQGWQRPMLSLTLAVAMFSLAGIPPTIGFVAKFLVFKAVVAHGLVWLAVIGVLNSFVSVFYYLRVVYMLYMRPLPRRAPAFTEPWPVKAVAAVCVALIVGLGTLPGWLVNTAQVAAKALFAAAAGAKE
jgi:NADH-quinone oxidoreductase subunit N